MEFDALVGKVQRGERLTPGELATLRAAPPSRRQALALAHALIELEAAREALEVLDALRRTRPDDPEVLLGRARALLLLERIAEAETSLETASRLNPSDPEPLKVLAVLALRRAEFARARALVTRVLLQDPFDAEAQALQSELEAGEVAPAPPAASRTDFLIRLTFALREHELETRRQGHSFLIKRPGGPVSRVNSDELYKRYLSSGLALEAAVAQLSKELAELLSSG